MEKEPMNRSASDLSLNSTDREARPPEAVKPARAKAWQARPDRVVLMQKDPALKAQWVAPYLAAAASRLSGREMPEEVDQMLRLVGCPKWLRGTARRAIMVGWNVRAEAPTVQRQSSFRSPPAIIRDDRYRSDYERRLAAALTRLGIRFLYESATFDYRDARGGWHNYTPDFTLVDLHATFVEVKGIRGAASDARVKMWHVLRKHSITLLLWDAPIIEMVEDMQSASEVVGLLDSTRLAA